MVVSNNGSQTKPKTFRYVVGIGFTPNPVGGPGATGATSFVLIDVGGVQLEEAANLLELAPVAAEAIQQLGRNGSGN